MNEDKVICMNCGRPFPVWDIHEKTIKCPFCNAKGNNPYYVKPTKPKPENMFTKVQS